MKTAEALESMTDAGEFEILATRVLRIEEEACRHIEHMGVNAEGKTITNPLDAFWLVPLSKPPRFIMAAFTTFKPKSLERKWLFDHTKAPRTEKATAADDGDLVKAARSAEALRQSFPDAEFVVYLCTNRVVDDEMMANVYRTAGEVGLNAVIFGQSNIRDCLDMKPEGQWLRKEHLGIDAELLSLSLLRQLSYKSLELYASEFLFTTPDLFVPTEALRLLASPIQLGTRSVHVVIGTSGFGKSVASYQILEDHIVAGGVGLRIPGEIAGEAQSIEEALERTLWSLHPTIQVGAGAIALSMGTPHKRLLLVVDDVNRTDKPANVIQKVVQWAKPMVAAAQNKDAVPRRNTWLLIIPAWELYWAPRKDLYKSLDWIGQIPVGRMNEDDAVSCLKTSLMEQAGAFSDGHLVNFSQMLGGDPILIAMFAQLVRTGGYENALPLIHQVMERFVDSAIREVASEQGHLETDYGNAIMTLAGWMLDHRELHPLWTEIGGLLSTQQMQALRELARIRKICEVSGKNAEERFHFRHDRILEYYLAVTIGRMLEKPEQHSDTLSDPFFLSFLGRAMATTPVSDKAVTWVRAHSPVALMAAVRFLRTDKDAGAEHIVMHAKQWLADALLGQGVPPAMIHESCRLLEQTDSSIVLKITEPIRDQWHVGRARLANGDALANVLEFRTRDRFWPASIDLSLERVLKRALDYHGNGLIAGCSKILKSANLDEREIIRGLILAGYIAAEELGGVIRAAWDAAPNKNDILIPALWAATRCGAQDPAVLIAPMMTVWASLPDEEAGGGLSERGAVAEELRFSMRHGVSENVLNYLVDSAAGNEALQNHIVWTLIEVDHPVVVQYVVRVLVTKGYSLWFMKFCEHWDPTYYRGHRLSADSLNAIRELWELSDNEELLRKEAFNAWLSATDDLAELEAIPPEHPYFVTALWRRAQLGDRDAVSHVKQLLPSEKQWFRVLAPIWSSEFLESVDRALSVLDDKTPSDFSGGETNFHHDLAHLLRDIPREDGEELLTRHWNYLQYSLIFVQLALYIGTSSCTALANAALEKWPPDTEPLKHISHFFGFGYQGLSDHLSMVHLEAVKPYLQKVDDHSIGSMTEFCARHGYRDWGEWHLLAEIERRLKTANGQEKRDRSFLNTVRRRLFPSDMELLQDLDDIQQRGHPEWIWCEEFQRRHDNPNRWRDILDQWLAQSPVVDRHKIAGRIINQIGGRQDIQLLTKYSVGSEQKERDRLVANVEFSVKRKSLK